MKLPFPSFLLNTDITINLEKPGPDGIETDTAYEGKCIFDEKSRTQLTADRRLVTLSALVIVPGDINPGKDIMGTVVVNGSTRKIAGTRRPRNPDGSVFSTEIDLE